MDRLRALLSNYYRTYLCGVLLCVCGTLLAQQSTHPKSFWLGIKGGAVATRFQFNPSVRQSMYIGRTAGIQLRYEMERGASAQLEFNYVNTGWTEAFADNSLSYTRHLTYVEMPFLTQLYLEKSVVRLFVNLGPYIGFNLSDRSSVSGTRFTNLQRLRQSMPVANRISWGLTGGPGLSFRLGGRHRLELEARATFSFADVWSNRRTDPYGQSAELRFAGMLGYVYRF